MKNGSTMMTGDAREGFTTRNIFVLSSYSMLNTLLLGAFLVDSLLWKGALDGLDFRGIYVVLFLAILWSVGKRRLIYSKEQLAILAFLAAWSVPALVRDPTIAPVAISQLVGSLGLGFLANFLLTTRLGVQLTGEQYLRIAKVLAGFVILDQVLYLAGGIAASRAIFGLLPARSFEPYVEFGVYRASGLLYEPSQVGLLVGPAVCFWLVLRRYKAAAWGALAMLCSFSATALIGLAVAVVLSRSRPARAIPWLLVVAVLVSAVALQLPTFQTRLGAMVVNARLLADGNDITANALAKEGGTVATLTANTRIAYVGTLTHPIFGWGLGSFRVFHKHLLNIVFPNGRGDTVFHNPAGASLMLRMLFELGIGGALFVFVAYALRVRRAKRCGLLHDKWRRGWVLAATCFFILCLLRKDMIVSFYFWYFLTAFLVVTRTRAWHLGSPTFKTRNVARTAS